VKLTPPHGLSQGLRALAGDMRKLFLQIDSKVWRVIVDQKGLLRVYPIHRKANRRGAKVTDRVKLMGFEQMKAFHYARLNGRGRVTGTRIDNLVGRKKSDIAQVGLVSRASYRKYKAQAGKRIGKAKAGFIPAMAAVGGRIPGSWITRHGAPEGEAADVHLADGEHDARLTVINRARGIQHLSSSSIATAIRYRGNAMEKHVDKLLELRAAEANLK
jgi:hypothetical protein